ncbi:ATP-dependent DNA helicase PIF1-like [Nilaparvata lugens]|uniref:ATP-dependent DNA helicase PIF1-like n=1 Tax=Nilaparvata lugens TaxID=108931 RepID=UPI00193D3647|nr:ATP-dependent DNA helicase PIF1-like [Nilaparvata lugens]
MITPKVVSRVTNEIADRLNLTRSQVIGGNGIQATRLCCYTNEANTINKTNLENLAGESKDFEASDSDKGNSKILDEYTPVENTISLKVGAQVMLVKNINVSKGLVNGARGVVTKFSSGLPVVKFLSVEYTVKQEKWIVRAAGGLMLTRIQLPLKLAWAFSIHKSQGLTLDCVEMNLSQVFEAGQAYVALSRAKSLDCLRVIDFDIQKIWANPDVLKFYKRLDQRCRELESISEFIPLGRKK